MNLFRTVHEPAKITLDFARKCQFPTLPYLYALVRAGTTKISVSKSIAALIATGPGERWSALQGSQSDLLTDRSGLVYLRSLLEAAKFQISELLCPVNNNPQPQSCAGNFRRAKQALQVCGFPESDWSDVFHVLMEQGGFATARSFKTPLGESWLKAQHWRRSHEGHI